MENTNTHESSEDYLERILMLSENGTKLVKAVDLSVSMGFSKPSVSVALKKLEAQGYVYLGERQSLHLTPEGLEIAERVYERHQILAKMLMAIGVGQKTAYKDACRIEHDLSDETWNALKEHYQHYLKKD